MAIEHLRESALPRALSDVLSDLSDLVQKEMRLARAEISAKISAKVRAGVYMSAAGFLGLIALFLALQGVVFWIASLGLAMHWSCLIVAAAIALIAGLAFLKGRADAREELTPSRTIHQIKQDITTTKEQLT
jgi:VIT1/CCC1 family predicted Fe2+/Mn2+ transporter